MEPENSSGEESGLSYLQGGYYVSRGPLKPDILYQLRLDKITCQGLCPYTMQFGISKTCSSYSELLQDMSLSQWKFYNKEGGVAGLMIDRFNKLYFYLDEKVIDTLTENVSGPRYAVFKFNQHWKMTPLPLKMMAKQEQVPPLLVKVTVVEVRGYYKERSNERSNNKQSSCTVL